MDFCAGTMAIGAAALALNRISINIEKETICYTQALERMHVLIEKIEAEREVIGKITNSAKVISWMVRVPGGETRNDEPISPLGMNNWPGQLNCGLGQTARMLKEDCEGRNIVVRDSGLPSTADGPSGRALFATADFEKDKHVAGYWGSFLAKSSRRYRQLRGTGQGERFLQMQLRPMRKFVLVGHPDCAATYIQGTGYDAEADKKNGAPNIVFREQQASEMSPLNPGCYVTAVTTRAIKKGEMFFACYRGSLKRKKSQKKNGKVRKRRKARAGSDSESDEDEVFFSDSDSEEDSEGDDQDGDVPMSGGKECVSDGDAETTFSTTGDLQSQLRDRAVEYQGRGQHVKRRNVNADIRAEKKARVEELQAQLTVAMGHVDRLKV